MQYNINASPLTSSLNELKPQSLAQFLSIIAGFDKIMPGFGTYDRLFLLKDLEIAL